MKKSQELLKVCSWNFKTNKETKKNKSKKKVWNCSSVQLFNPASDLWIVGFIPGILRDGGDSDVADDIVGSFKKLSNQRTLMALV